MRWSAVSALGVGLICGCGAAPGSVDAGLDGGGAPLVDGGSDAGALPGADGGSDASITPTPDGGSDAGSTPAPDAGTDAGTTPTRDGGFTHEPPGFILLGEWKNEAGLTANGWYPDQNPTAWGSKSRVTSGYAGVPRVGGSAAILTFYDGGTEGGHDPGREQFNLPAGTRELFFAAELQFAADYPTSTSSGGNKQLFVTFPNNQRYFVNLDEGAANGKWGIYQQSSPLVDSSIDVVYGQWVTVEWYLKKDTGAADGVMRLWVDGALALERLNLTFPPGDMVNAYDDGSNNGNHYPLPADMRKIGTDLGGPVSARRWVSVLRVSAPPP